MRFSNGDDVEVTWDDEGFRGAWYEAKVIRTMAKTRRYSVVYDHLVADVHDDDDGGGEEPRPLREMADFARVRPRPPLCGGPFTLHQPVDAWHNEGWWTGVVVAASDAGGSAGSERYTVRFPSPREQMDFAAAEVRVHLEWVDDVWVRPDENTPGPEALAFPAGGRVEVVSILGDSQVMWLVATVEKHIWENNLLVQYENREVDVGGESLREIIHVHHVRPCPPLTSDSTKFSILEEVEAFYADGWCNGVIARIHGDSKYNVKSNHWEGEMEFHRSKLRPWFQWEDGCWVQPSKHPIPNQRKSIRCSQRSKGREGACKSHSSFCIPISSDSQGSSTSSDTEMGNELNFECHTAISPSPKNPYESDTVQDDTLLLSALVKERAAKSTVKAGKEFATSAVRGRGKSQSIGMLAVKQPCLKRQSKGTIAKSLNFGGGKGFLGDGKFAHKSGEKINHLLSANHEIKEVHGQLKWVRKFMRKCRMNAKELKRKAYGNPKKCRRKSVVGGRCGITSETKDLNTETSLEAESLGDPPESGQLVNENPEPSEESHHLLQLDSIVQANPPSVEIAAQELLNVVLPNYTGSDGISIEIQHAEPASVKENVDLNTYIDGRESWIVVSEKTEIRTEVVPGCSPSKFKLPFTKSSPMWEAIAGMDVFHALPQQPHFRPLINCCSELREGMAIGLMVTFDKLVNKITKLQINDPENIFEESLNMLNHLEDHGFDVRCIQDRLEKLQRIRYEQGQYENKKSTLQELILKGRNEGQKLADEIDVIDKSVKEMEKAMVTLRDRRSALVIQRETNEHEIAELQVDEKSLTQTSLSAREEFDSTLAAAWFGCG
ncbi:hypothetical protein Taro_048689 [Colocasia esculenta]|uniref:Agenet domain-containing protein n=1 Tax=Colocasia esculenta TaxID=4460 RepID=A0A843X8V3_COLES|nr:hypothetical protein [Colocasia esculenta]